MKSVSQLLTSILFPLILISCGGGGGGPDLNATFSIGGTVSGLRDRSSLTLLSNTVTSTVWQSTTITDNGPFTLSMPVKFNGSFAVSVGIQPLGQTCSVQNGSGAGIVGNVSNLSVICSDLPLKVSGTVSGLADGGRFSIQNNNGDQTTISSNGPFEFASPIPKNGSFAATIVSQPVGQICSVNSGSGVGLVSDVSTLSIVCSDASYKLSGTVLGLVEKEQVTLFNNLADATSVIAGPLNPGNTAFAFKTPIAKNGSFSVTVATQPSGKTCTVLNGWGVSVFSDVSNISVVCSPISFKISGTVVGLNPGSQLTLTNNAESPVIIKSSGPFTFPSAVALNGSYKVVVLSQPPNQTCSPKDVKSLSRSGITSDVADLEFVCNERGLVVAGTVVGLSSAQNGGSNATEPSFLTLLNNGGDAISLATNGSFKFLTPIAYGGSYAVTVATQPAGKICTVGLGTGQGVTKDVTNVAVVCSNTTLDVAGVVRGLDSGRQVTLLNNASDPTIVTANGPFRFASPVAFGASYSVVVGTQPTGQRCSPTFGSGSYVSTNVNNIEILCEAIPIRVRVTVAGLRGGPLLMFNNGGDVLSAPSDGEHTFKTPISYNGSYSVSIAQQPPGQVCTVTRGSGVGATEDVTNVSVICR